MNHPILLPPEKIDSVITRFRYGASITVVAQTLGVSRSALISAMGHRFIKDLRAGGVTVNPTSYETPTPPKKSSPPPRHKPVSKPSFQWPPGLPEEWFPDAATDKEMDDLIDRAIRAGIPSEEIGEKTDMGLSYVVRLKYDRGLTNLPS